jgi:hypothetical protein
MYDQNLASAVEMQTKNIIIVIHPSKYHQPHRNIVSLDSTQ